MLSKEDIFSAQDLETVVVEVPEWGGKVCLSVMSGVARDNYESSLFIINKDGSTTPNLENSRAKLLAACIVDENGKQLFASQDIAKLGLKNGLVLDRLHSLATELNASSSEQVEELAKN